MDHRSSSLDPQTRALAFFRSLLSKVLDGLLAQVAGPSKTEKVKQSLKSISELYQKGLSRASSEFRSDWDDPANRCAYVFLYLIQHCHLVYFSLEDSGILRNLSLESNLKVCSIGGGPGSDLVGLTTFLRENSIFPPTLECLVLDLYPSWKNTWNTISEYMPDYFNVEYHRCDLVRDTGVPSDHVRRFIEQADMLTFVKSFSAIAAFFRTDRRRGDFLRDILRKIKPGCLVLYIDNNHEGDTQFQREFAAPAGLDVVFEFRGQKTVPRRGQYPRTILKYIDHLGYHPMRSCDVIIQLFCKTGSVHSGRAVSAESHPSPRHISSTITPSRSPSSSSTGRQAAQPYNPYRLRNQVPRSNPVSVPAFSQSSYPSSMSYTNKPTGDDRRNEGLSIAQTGILLGIGFGVLLLMSYLRNK